MTYSTKDKLDEVLRELAMRRNVYPSMIQKGSMSVVIAKRRIEIMAEIAEDLQQKLARDLLV